MVKKLLFKSAILLSVSPSVWALGQFELNTTSFLLRSNNRGGISGSLVAGPNLYGVGPVFEAKADVRAYMLLTDRRQLNFKLDNVTPEAPDLYVATSPILMPHHQITIGRRRMEWTQLDSTWDLGLWTPRFLWDPIHPTPIGLTGLFYEYHSSSWQIRAYLSPLSIPERGLPIQNRNGTITADDPMYVNPPNKLVMGPNAVMDAYYSLQMPNMSEALLRGWMGAAYVRMGEESGPWFSGGLGRMPIHQPNVALDVNNGIDFNSMSVNAKIHPQFRSQQLLTAETGVRSKTGALWASFTRIKPEEKGVDGNLIYSPFRYTSVFALGASLGHPASGRVYASTLLIDEERDDGEMSTSMGTNARFWVSRAVMVGGEVAGRSNVDYGMKLVWDFPNTSGIVSADMSFFPEKSRAWKVGVGGDVFISSTAAGTVGQYVGDDRVRGSVSYVF